MRIGNSRNHEVTGHRRNVHQFFDERKLVNVPSVPSFPRLRQLPQPRRFLRMERFKMLAIEDCIHHAKRLTKGRIPCQDKATAIALILGAEGRCS